MHASPVVLLAAFAALCAATPYWSLPVDLSGHFGTGTPYTPGTTEPYPAPENYTVVALSSVGRHGSRYPTAGKVKSFKKVETLLTANRAALLPSWMKTWTNDFDSTYDGVLCSRGAQELMGIGSRIASYYDEVILPYNPNTVVATCTFKPRTAQTAVAFGLGALRMSGFRYSPFAANEDSTGRELRFFEECTAYVNSVEDNDTAQAPLTAYQTATYAKLAPKLATKTGLTTAQLLSGSMVQNFWDLCVYETLVHGRRVGMNGWCSLFDLSDAKAMEFADDIDKYINCGYGNKLSYMDAVPLLKAIVAHLNDVVAGGTVRARLRFAHAETVMPLLALLGLYHDEVPLSATMTQAQMDARVWRTSEISKMGTNVFFVLATSKTGAPLVQVLHNESPVVLTAAGCTSVWCPLSTIKTGYAAALATDFDTLCSA
eukprot:m51a1_g5518 hypothetical protein (430) ;mRNA; r:409101-410484